jgi:hypothetical protein
MGERSDVIVVDSITRLPAGPVPAVVVAASHGGRYAAAVALGHGVRAVVFNDASRGLEDAGVAGLGLLETAGVPAAAVAAASARIGDGTDQRQHGRLSVVNGPARALGLAPGMRVDEALLILQDASPPASSGAPEVVEGRWMLSEGPPRVWALDSVSLTTHDDDGDILVTGSHGALLGGDPSSAVKSDPLAVVYNDAGGGPDDRGRTRLPALDARGIAAATVEARTARIGDGRSTYETGIVSTVNVTAERRGATPGMTTRDFVDLFQNRPLGEPAA